LAAGVPRAVVVAVTLAALVAAGALGGAAVLRWRATHAAGMPTTSVKPPAAGAVGPSGCLKDPCQVVASATVGGTVVDLVADAGGTSGRLRVGGPNSGSVIEASITDMGVTLTSDSLQCAAGGLAACLIKGKHDGGIAGQVVVGRSGYWSAQDQRYISNAGYLAVANVDQDSVPEILAAQRDCAGTDPAACAAKPVFIQVFSINGKVVGCTRNYPRLDKVPGYPAVQVTKPQLVPCPTGQ
jgi:hypothetical protein